jgi:arginine decarboxylase
LSRREWADIATAGGPAWTARGQRAAGLTIAVTSGAGSGRTRLSAFDAALCAAGAGDFNLVRLSSVIPAGSRINRQTGHVPGDFGDVLYCVYAESFADTPGQEAWAGLGWVAASCGRGLFVEHSDGSRAAVERQIHLSLSDMTALRPDDFGPIEYQLSSAVCRDRPVCAVVLAAYRASSWRPG